MEYRCFHCKQAFTEESLARQHFGKSPVEFPTCIHDALMGNGGGPHDPYMRVRKDEYERLLRLSTPESDSIASTTHENPKSDKLTPCQTDSD